MKGIMFKNHVKKKESQVLINFDDIICDHYLSVQTDYVLTFCNVNRYLNYQMFHQLFSSQMTEHQFILPALFLGYISTSYCGRDETTLLVK